MPHRCFRYVAAFPGLLAAGALLAANPAVPQEKPSARVVTVHDADGLRRAVRAAKPGTRIEIAPGTYPGGFYFDAVRGAANRPIILAAADPARPPLFQGGSEAFHFSRPAYLELHNLSVSGQSANGLNLDDGGKYDDPNAARHIVLRGLTVRDVGSLGGNHDGIKLSGLNDFRIEKCRVENWAGAGIDMVGCHRGVIQNSLFRHRDNSAGGQTGDTGIQAKGGCRDIRIQNNRFENAGARGVNIGGSTGLEYFRPPLQVRGAENRFATGEAASEAANITVEDNVFIGGTAPLAFVGVDGAKARFNTIYVPQRWAFRILQETRAPGFVACRNGEFTDNLIVFRSDRWAEGGVNIGTGTLPKTFRFARNAWHCLDRPDRSRPTLPTPETDGLYGQDPRFIAAETGDLRLRQGSPAQKRGPRTTAATTPRL